MSDRKPRSSAESAVGDGSSLDSLNFLDLIYTVPVGDLAMRVSGAKLDRVPAVDWSALAMILTLIVLSWVGLHKNRADMAGMIGGQGKRAVIGEFSFFELRFVQFVVEVVIIGLYFVMGLNLILPTADHPAPMPLSEGSLTEVLLWIFVAYIVWDILDVCLAAGKNGDCSWLDTAAAGGAVTLLFSIPVAAIYLTVGSTSPHTAKAVIWLNLCLIVLLYIYRVAQDIARRVVGRYPVWGRRQDRQAG